MAYETKNKHWEDRNSYHEEIRGIAKNVIANTLEAIAYENGYTHAGDPVEQFRGMTASLNFLTSEKNAGVNIVLSDAMQEEIETALAEETLIFDPATAVKVVSEWTQNPDAAQGVHGLPITLREDRNPFYEVAMQCAYHSVRADVTDHLNFILGCERDGIEYAYTKKHTEARQKWQDFHSRNKLQSI